MEIEKILLDKCFRLISEKLNWGDYRRWKNEYYKRLSAIIHEDTGVLLSSSTLKRITGKMPTGDDYNPQFESKTALALYLGYKNWDDFAQAHIVDVKISKNNKAPVSTVPAYRFSGKKKLITLMGALMVGCFAYWLYESIVPSRPTIEVSFRDSVGIAPGIIYIDYALSGLGKNDSVQMKYMRSNVFLDPLKNSISARIDYPDIHTIRFELNNEPTGIVKKVHMTNEGWQLVVKGPNKYNRVFNNQEMLVQNGLLTVTDTVAKQIKPLEVSYNIPCDFRRSADFGIDGDDFEFEAGLINMADPTLLDDNRDIIIMLNTDKYYNKIHFARPCCISSITQSYSEVKITGKTTDLKTFGHDFNTVKNVRVRVKAKTVTIFFEGNLIYTFPYKENAGMLKAIVVMFRGKGGIDYIKLRDAEGNYKLNDDF